MVHSLRRLLPSLLIPMVVSASFLTAKMRPHINMTLEYGLATECKTCPYSLCTNKVFYQYNTEVTLVCWTRGTKTEGDATWLATTDGCYITQDDLVAYNGTYETDLSYCGPDSEERHLTYDATTVKYDTECNICPDNSDCANVKYLSPGTYITVTWWTDDGGAVIGDKTWLKTTDNCYVAERGLQDPANREILDSCGLIGFIQQNYTYPKRRSSSPAAEPITLPDLTRPPNTGTELKSQYILNITVGEEFAYCHSCANTTCETVTRYPYKHEVWVQCYVDNEAASNPNETWWYETTDFCYVKEVDFFQSLFDAHRFPSCDQLTSASG